MMPTDFTWREYRSKVVMHTIFPIFVDSKSTKTPTYRHHTSLYGFTEKEAKQQMRLGNTKNRKIEHYSGELVIDTDNTETAEKVWQRCLELNIPFELCKLNNYKFYLERDITDLPSPQMVYQDRQFVRNNFMDCNINGGLDLGIYSSPFHLMRARNSIHEVTGAKSEIIDKNTGANPIKTNHIEIIPFQKSLHQEEINISAWQKFQISIDLAQGKGANKHFCLFSLGKNLQKVLDITTALEIAKLYASSLDYDEEKAMRAMRQAYES